MEDSRGLFLLFFLFPGYRPMDGNPDLSMQIMVMEVGMYDSTRADIVLDGPGIHGALAAILLGLK